MITETKAKQKRKNYSKKSVLSLFPKQKEFNWPSDFNLSLSFTTLLSYCSVFQICTRLHSICGQEKQKLFSSKNSLFINAWDSRILKEKRQKKINKKQTDHPPVFTAIVLLIARMCPFKFFLIITNKNNNQFKEKPTKKSIFSIFCLFFKKRENNTTIGNRNKKN